MKKILFLLLLSCNLVLFCACKNDDDDNISAEEAQTPAIPDQLTYYRINMEGNTTLSNFSRTACLYITPTIATNANFNNGTNEREVGIISGFPAGTPSPGAMWFFTNTSLCQYGATGCNATIINAALDISFVTVNEANRSIDVKLDGAIYNNTAAGPILTTNFLNHFTASPSLFATIYRTVTGKIKINFSEDGEKISGTIDVVGNNFSGSGTSVYEAVFTGDRVSISAAGCK